ncbi:hypothetical protein [Isoptericola sp. BMS4]|uniref:hypothetical protein n=1 Tax=Isoptericola sp. BMS4 TaxID=2527875 RepID=UPI00142337AC|nr:hypothetical protein [Isoptericola sp. BMS4]
MSVVISLSLAPVAVPDVLHELVSRIEVLRPAIRGTFTPAGGILRASVENVVRPVLAEAGFRPGSPATFLPTELNYHASGLAAVVSIQTGRASTNNGGLAATLSAASCVGVDWLLLLAPETYKGSTTAPKVESHLHELAAARGVHLDLCGVVLVSY